MSAPHSFSKKLLSWMYCARCGLIRLNNKATEDAVRQPCPSNKHASPFAKEPK